MSDENTFDDLPEVIAHDNRVTELESRLAALGERLQEERAASKARIEELTQANTKLTSDLIALEQLRQTEKANAAEQINELIVQLNAATNPPTVVITTGFATIATEENMIDSWELPAAVPQGELEPGTRDQRCAQARHHVRDCSCTGSMRRAIA